MKIFQNNHDSIIKNPIRSFLLKYSVHHNFSDFCDHVFVTKLFKLGSIKLSIISSLLLHPSWIPSIIFIILTSHSIAIVHHSPHPHQSLIMKNP